MLPRPRNMLHGVCLKLKPVGKPDAVAPHVRFDERGWETGLYATAPVLDSTDLLGCRTQLEIPSHFALKKGILINNLSLSLSINERSQNETKNTSHFLFSANLFYNNK